MAFLDKTGLEHLWAHIVSKINDAKIIVDDTLSSTSMNPVQNKVINATISNLSQLVNDAVDTASGAVATHNTSDTAHTDLRALIEGLTNRLNALADSDDTTLDQLSEIVTYIKSNKALIDAVTTGKVSVSDIVDNLTTNASGKVLSAAQGVALKAMIDGIVIPATLPNPQPITINGQRYDGSEAVEVSVTGSSGANIDDVTPSATTTYSSQKIESEIATLNAAIDAKGDPTDEQVSAAVNAYLDANPVSGGIGTTAKNLLITILRSGVYTADQSNNITALETALGGGTTEPEEPVEKTYAISNELVNCISSNSTASVKENASYSATLTANDGYTLTGGTVTVTMGGVDITATAYADGVITIAAVTGDVEIFASAIAVQAEAALPEDGLISYFDFRTTTYDNASSGGKTTIAPTKGSGQLYMWAKNSISAQNEYGLKPANSRKWEYDQNGGTNATALGNAFTVIQLTYGETPVFGFIYSNGGAYWEFYPQYINASGSTAYAAKVNGSNFNSDNKADYNFTVVRADGATLTEIFDTSRTTYNGGDIDGFSRWLDRPYGNTSLKRDNVYCTAMAIYNRALTDSEIEAAREFMKTLEVTA